MAHALLDAFNVFEHVASSVCRKKTREANKARDYVSGWILCFFNPLH